MLPTSILSLRFERRLRQLEEAPGLVLAVWAALNMVVSGALLFASHSWEHCFYLKNNCWG